MVRGCFDIMRNYKGLWEVARKVHIDLGYFVKSKHRKFPHNFIWAWDAW